MKFVTALTFPLVLVVVGLMFADLAHGQRGGRRGFGGFGQNRFTLLTREDVRNELELVDDQIKDLESLQEEASRMFRDMFSEIQELPREERREAMGNMREKMEERMKPLERKINDILLPHQQDRLKQLGFQNTGRGGNSAGGALNNEDLLDELDVTDEQKERIDEAMEKAQEELKKKYAKLVKEAEEKILKELDPEQRKKYRELVGDKFEFADRGGRFGRDRQGAGGRRGNDRRGDNRRRNRN